MERVGSISRRVLARLVAANDNLEWKGAGDAACAPPRLGAGRTNRSRAVTDPDKLAARWIEKTEPAGAVISPCNDRPAPGVTHITAETLPPDSVRSGAGKGAAANARADGDG